MIGINGVSRTRVELATHDTDLKADIGDFSGQTNLQTLLAALGIPDVAAKPLYTCLITDRLDNATYGLSAIHTDVTTVIDDLANGTDGLGALKALIDTAQGNITDILADTGTAGVVLGTKVAAYKKLIGENQITLTTEDLNQVAATYDLFTGTDQAVLLTALTVKMPTGDAGGSVTSISIQTDDATPGVIINSTDGAVANLTSEAEISWVGAMRIEVGTKIQLTIGGGAHGSEYLTKILAKHEALVDGGYLAVSA